MMLTRYFFIDEFSEFEEVLRSYPHIVEHFHSQTYLGDPGSTIKKVYYIVSGLTQVSVVHDSGEDKIFAFWGQGGIFPLICSEQDFYLEHSILQKAMSEVVTLSFSTEVFRQIMMEHPEIACECIDHYCRWSNLLLFNATTSAYETVRTRVCNLLYTYLYYLPNKKRCVNLEQKDIASIVGASRVSVARCLAELREEGIVATSRGKLYVMDADSLKTHTSEYCK